MFWYHILSHLEPLERWTPLLTTQSATCTPSSPLLSVTVRISTAQPILYWCARNIPCWSSISFNLLYWWIYSWRFSTHLKECEEVPESLISRDLMLGEKLWSCFWAPVSGTFWVREECGNAISPSLRPGLSKSDCCVSLTFLKSSLNSWVWASSGPGALGGPGTQCVNSE